MKRHIDPLATAALIGNVIAVSLIPLFLKYFTPYIDSWTANGIRYPIGALVWIPWLWMVFRNGRADRRLWKMALLPTVANILGQIFWAMTPYYLDPGLISFMIRLATLWAVLGSFILFQDERRLLRSPHFWAGFTLAVSGFVVMVLGGRQSLGSVSAVGILIVLLASLGWAAYQLTIRRNLSHTDPRTAFGAVSCMTSVGLVTAMFCAGNPGQALALPSDIVLLVILSGLVGIALSHVLLYFAIRRLGVAICSSTNLSGAFLTALLSFHLFGERLTSLQWFAGCMLVAGGVLLVYSQTHLRR